MEPKSPTPIPPGSLRNLQAGLLWMAAFACLPAVFLGIEWLTATATLGHKPIPSVNDPKFISPLSGALHTLTGISIPIALFGIVGRAAMIQNTLSTRQRLFINLSAVFFLAGSIALVFGLPSDDVVTWWFD